MRRGKFVASSLCGFWDVLLLCRIANRNMPILPVQMLDVQREDSEGFYYGCERMRLGEMCNFSFTNITATSAATSFLEK
jgi:hypothetical protein